LKFKQCDFLAVSRDKLASVVMAGAKTSAQPTRLGTGGPGALCLTSLAAPLLADVHSRIFFTCLSF